MKLWVQFLLYTYFMEFCRHVDYVYAPITFNNYFHPKSAIKWICFEPLKSFETARENIRKFKLYMSTHWYLIIKMVLLINWHCLNIRRQWTFLSREIFIVCDVILRSMGGYILKKSCKIIQGMTTNKNGYFCNFVIAPWEQTPAGLR